MSQIPVFPDELVHLICEVIAYNKGEITLPELWRSSESFIGLSDDKLKEFVFSCVSSHPDITLYERGMSSEKLYSEVEGNEDSYTLRISEDALWTILTGYRKKEANIGGFAFELLLEIAKAGDKGINTKDLALATNQDPRSITGRVKKIGHLICSVQMIYKGHVVKLLKLKRYSESDNAVKPYINLRDYLGQIVDVVKKSKNGVRQIIDLKRELKFDVEKRLSKAFIAAIAWLDEKEYLKKVLLVSPTNPSVKIRCVKYLRDYVHEDKSTNDFDYESEPGDDPLDDDKIGLEEEDAYEGLDSSNATNILQEEGLLVQDEKSAEKDEILMNRFYPIQNQTYDMTEKAGLQGISTMDVIKRLTGRDYKRAFTKSSEYYVESVGKPKSNVDEYSIVRVYDFEGRKKFYRFFTEENFKKLTCAPQAHISGRFEPIENQAETLAELNESNFIPLSSSLRFIDNGGQESFFWNGEIKSPVSVSSRGRKRKQEDVAAIQKAISANNKRRSVKQKERLPSVSRPDSAASGGDVVNSPSVASDNDGSNKPRVLEIGGFSAGSLRSLWRQRAILEVVRKAGGVTYLREQFFEDVSHFMGSNTLLDKKTVRGDVNLMLQNEKLRMEDEPHTGKRIIYLPEIDPNAIANYIIKEKDNKKAYFKDVIHNTDIYFFDQTEKHRFHRGVKSAERVRNYQDRSRSKKGSQQKAWKKKTEDALSLQRQYKLSRDLTAVGEKEPSKKNVKAGKGKKKALFQVGNKLGVRALVMAVVITKSIKNEILWDEITKLFPSNSLSNLKKQWTAQRIRMGHVGWRAYVDKWRKILVSATREERVTLEDVERLDLPKLIDLWITSDIDEDQKPILLYRDYLENKKRYTLIRVGTNVGMKSGLAMSSMIQRETSSLKKIFVYDNCDASSKQLLPWGTEGDVRAVIRSILYDHPDTSREKIEILSTIPKELVDKVIMDMAKEKHLYLQGSRLEATDTIKEFLQARGNYKMFEQCEMYRNKLEEMFQAGNGVIISEEIPDVASWIFIDLIAQSKVNLDVIPTVDSSQKLSYVTRRLGIRGLTPPLVMSAKKSTKLTKEVQVPLPMGEPNSKLWVDGMGCLRRDVWKCLLSMITNEILFNPGVTVDMLEQNCNFVLSKRELGDICRWLLKKGLVSETPFEGLQAGHEWYTLLR